MTDRPADIISPTSSEVRRAGAELVTTFALGCELQADWKLPSAKP